MDFSETKKYILSKGISCQEFDINQGIENIEFYINRVYFCSVGRWDSTSFEVFELHHGAQISEDSKDFLTDGELWQYKVYGSLKRAIDFALKSVASKRLTDKPIRRW